MHPCAVPRADLVSLQRQLVRSHLDHHRLKQRRDDVGRDQVRFRQQPGIAHWSLEGASIKPVLDHQVADLRTRLGQGVPVERHAVFIEADQLEVHGGKYWTK